jgi:hypothetical protein
VTEDDIVGKITNIAPIAKGTGVHIRQYLNQRYGFGRWRKLKGIALARDDFGGIYSASWPFDRHFSRSSASPDHKRAISVQQVPVKFDTA